MDPALLTLTTAFRAWLSNRHYSDSTIRNYLVDINKYLASAGDNLLFSSTTLQNYLQTLSSHPNFPRAQASLKKFFQFALDQKLIDQNPFKKALRFVRADPHASPSQESLISAFQTYLEKKNKTPTTIKNYINDIQQFINWASQSTPTPSFNKEGNLKSPLSKGDLEGLNSSN